MELFKDYHNHELQHLSPRQQQNCPLCGELQTIMLRGKVADIETGVYHVVGDKGYSFCNCRNIFFTNWKNIDLTNYDENYAKRAMGDQEDRVLEVEKQWEIAQRFCPKAKSFLNVGDYEDRFLDYLKNNDWNNMSLATIDIIPRESKHRFICANFEDWDTDEKFDIVWMSHFMEHIRDPRKILDKVKKLLNPGGILFNAMPDTNHINWGDPTEFPFLTAEHHILWNMYDWIDFAEDDEFKCVFKQLSHDVITRRQKEIKRIDYCWIKESRTIFQKLP
jgi:SAM-dependent methyltransferase